MDPIKELKEILGTKKNIVITTHQNPDGDAMGSSLGLMHYMRMKGHNAIVITPNDHPEYLHWLPGNEDVVIFRDNKEVGKKLVNEADVIFCLDFNDLRRIADLGTVVKKADGTKVLIDHHLQPTEFADYKFCNAMASSTAELVFDFINDMGDDDYIEENIANCIYTGVMTDTGAFQFPSTTPKVHRMVAELMDRGVKNYRAYDLVYNHYSENRIRFFGFCITERLKVYHQYGAALIYISKEDQIEYNVVKGDTEGLVNLPLQIRGINLACLIIDREDIVKISLRSKGDLDVNNMARKHFNGGGHKNASGGSSNDSLEDTIKKFEEILPEVKGIRKKKSEKI